MMLPLVILGELRGPMVRPESEIALIRFGGRVIA
jgi:hypothetical protein